MPRVAALVAGLLLSANLLLACSSNLPPPVALDPAPAALEDMVSAGSRPADALRPAAGQQLSTVQTPAPAPPGAGASAASLEQHPLIVRIVDGLRQRGLRVEPAGSSTGGLAQSAPGLAYRVTHGWLALHLYPDAAAAAADAAQLPERLRQTTADYPAPHFFLCDRLIALTFGAAEPLVAALSELCAPPFYSPELIPTMPAATEIPLTSIESALAHVIHNDGLGQLISAPEILVQRPLTSGVALLYTYQRDHSAQGLPPEVVVRFQYLDRRGPIWYPDGSLSEIVEPAAGQPALQLLYGSFVVNGGADTPEKPDALTFAGGLVNDQRIQHVRVVYSDGVVEHVPVWRGAYLSVRLDVVGLARVEGLDILGSVVSVQER